MEIERFFEILLSDKPSESICNNEREVFELIPALSVCKGFDQKNPWHIYDVYEHTLRVVDGVPSNLPLRLTALFHDIGKPASMTIDDDGVGHFYGHWNKSVEIFTEFASNYQLDKDMTELVKNLIYYHDLRTDDPSAVIEDFKRVFSSEDIKLLFAHKRSDLLAHSEEKHASLPELINQEVEILKLYEESI